MRLRFLPERREIQSFAGVPAAVIAAFRISSHPLERITETKLEQDTRCIRRYLQAGPNLSERGGLLEQLHVYAVSTQR